MIIRIKQFFERLFHGKYLLRIIALREQAMRDAMYIRNLEDVRSLMLARYRETNQRSVVVEIISKPLRIYTEDVYDTSGVPMVEIRLERFIAANRTQVEFLKYATEDAKKFMARAFADKVYEQLLENS